MYNMTLNCNGNLLDLSQPKVMGVLNLTPDSFFDGGMYKDEDQIIARVKKMILDGAAIIDVGAYSSKPNAASVSVEEEKKRLLPVIKLLIKQFSNLIISVDTFRAEIANLAVNEGAAIINDISAGVLDANMFKTIAELQVPYIMMHMRGNPQTMQSLTNYENLTQELIYYFSERMNKARDLGINDLVIDPGFGFAKTREQNFELLNKLELFSVLDCPVLVGVSRKSMIYKTLDITPQDALNGTTVLNTIVLQKGAKIIRVHDVKDAVEAIKLVNELH
jgi:dihydropteroate synthase